MYDKRASLCIALQFLLRLREFCESRCEATGVRMTAHGEEGYEVAGPEGDEVAGPERAEGLEEGGEAATSVEIRNHSRTIKRMRMFS